VKESDHEADWMDGWMKNSDEDEGWLKRREQRTNGGMGLGLKPG